MSMYRLVAVLILSMYLVSPGMVDSWISSDHAWYSPFVIWLILIMTVAWLEHKRSQDDI